MDDINDVPPLEDMSELLEQTKQIQRQSQKETSSLANHPPSSASVLSTNNTPLLPSKDVASGNTPSSTNYSERTSETTNAEETVQAAKSSSLSSGGFGGMKKGFLFGGPSKKSTPTGKSSAILLKPAQKADTNPVGGNDIPLIQPREGGGDGKEQYRIEEVQDALKATAPLLQNKDWVTDDLLANLKDHPRLAKQLTDPRFAQAVQKFQSNPQLAIEEYRDNAEVQKFFKDFFAVLGDHFSSMGDASPPAQMPSSGTPPPQGIRTQPASSPDIAVRSSTDPKVPTATDEAKMQQILSDPEIMEILMDQRIQTLMNTLRSNPDQGQQILQSADPQMQGKIHKLVKAGLLGFN